MTDQLDGTRGGATFDAEFDADRLNKQARAVYGVMGNGLWYTLGEVESLTGYPQASISARIRDFRKPKYGGHVVERRRVDFGSGLWEYRVLTPTRAKP